MTVREKTIKYELSVTAPEHFNLEYTARRLSWAVKQIKYFWDEDIDLVSLSMVEEGEVQEVIK